MSNDKFGFKGKQEKKNFVRYNEHIRIPQILVIQDGNNLGVMQTRDAQLLAKNAGLDLVEVAPHSRPPVCQIMDYGKYMFNKSKSEKQKGAQQKEKEICFRYVISDGDLETKATQAKKFLEKGMKVKLVVKFKQREKAHRDLGHQLILKVIDMLKECSSVETTPKADGQNIIAKLVAKSEKKESKNDQGHKT